MNVWQQVMAVALLLTGITANAADTPLKGVPITITLTNDPQITVQKPGGGWYDTLALINAGSDMSLYQAQIPVEVNIRNGSNFRVSLVGLINLAHESKPGLVFTHEKVSFGASATTLQVLSTTPIDFSNTTIGGGGSTGLYVLSVSAREPAGVRDNISGNYVGVLVLLFEPKV